MRNVASNSYAIIGTSVSRIAPRSISRLFRSGCGKLSSFADPRIESLKECATARAIGELSCATKRVFFAIICTFFPCL
ncbi:MAG: hypothetical protein DMG33_04000 [Acidobacteria bacterium]|nr:MAG: hypothetical protein DMG33_04000 [Acidobacteriota bacterium]